MTQSLPEVTDQELAGLTTLFRLLSDPVRVRIMLLLSRGERNVTALCDDLDVMQPTVSHHLAVLRAGGLLTNRREGKAIHYALDGRVDAADPAELSIRAGTLRVRIGR